MIKHKVCRGAYPPLAGVAKGRGWMDFRYLIVISLLFAFGNIFSQTLGERIDGPANVRTVPNGEKSFLLNDNVLVGAGPIVNGWVEIQITIEIPVRAKNDYSLDSGQAIVDMDDDTVGIILGEVMTSIGSSGKQAWCSFYGYTHQSNIKTESIIENVIQGNIGQLEFNHLTWTNFIEDFGLEKFDSIGGYEVFMTYESIDDSPGFRIALLFENYNLVGLIHSRAIAQNGLMKNYQVGDYYSVLFVSDYSGNKVTRFQNALLTWLNGVD